MGLLKYNKFSCMPMKVRISLMQRALNDKGYELEVNGQMDKKTKKALKQLQESNGLAPNCVICAKTYDLLGINMKYLKE